jgi:predicted SAM-dependent methyltransferase
MREFIKKSLSPVYYERLKDGYVAARMNSNIAWGKLRRLVNPPPLPKNRDGSVNLHLGCGKIDHPGFINVDGIPDNHIHYVRRIDDLSPFKTGTIDLIYASHCLEHFSHRKILGVLTEWRRVLKVGGILRLSVPDFAMLVRVYQEFGDDLNPVIGALYGGQDYKFNYHYTAFNNKLLSEYLTLAGFDKIREWTPGKDGFSNMDDWSDKFIDFENAKYPVSLNLEAEKSSV